MRKQSCFFTRKTREVKIIISEHVNFISIHSKNELLHIKIRKKDLKLKKVLASNTCHLKSGLMSD